MGNFEKNYNNLNPEQKLAVDTIFWPLMVIAWPGSWKTQLLSVRIANILQLTDANPNNILCLTFTDNAARNMRERLKSIIGNDAYKVSIHTFHTFGMEIIQRFGYILTNQETLEPIDDISASRIFHEILEWLPFNNSWKKSYYMGTIRNSITNLKSAGLSPEDFEKILTINTRILEVINPIFEEWFEKISSLWQKKVEKEEKMRIFWELYTTISLILRDFPKNYKLQDTLAKTLLESMEHVIASWDPKLLTAWKNTYWEKNGKNVFVLKDFSKIVSSQELLDIYKLYRDKLIEWSFLDFSDMLLQAKSLLEEHDVVRMQMAEQYQWILIDEYQDTNDVQLSMVLSIAHVSDEPNIMVVWDDDQSIFKFQWASTRNLSIFREEFPDIKLIILQKNYRSYQEIIDFSRSILQEGNRLAHIFPWAEKKFLAHNETWGHVYSYEFDTELSEIEFASQEIEKIIEREKNNPHFSLKEIAVISKKNTTLEAIAKVLLEKKIAVTLSKQENIFDNEVVQIICKILEYIESITYGNDKDELLVEILSHEMWGLKRIDIWEISRKVALAKKSENKIWIEALKNSSNRNISIIAHFLIELSILSKNIRLEDLIDYITGAFSIDIAEDEYNDEDIPREQLTIRIDWEDIHYTSPLYEYYFSEEKLFENPVQYATFLANVRKLIESVRTIKKQKSIVTLTDFIEYLELIRTYNVFLSTSTLIGSEEWVQCITAHKSKGLEYWYVFAVGLTQTNFTKWRVSSNPFQSNFNLMPEKDTTEDIERLVYTMFTRAKHTLYLTYSRVTLADKSESALWILSESVEWKKNEQLWNNNIANILQNESLAITHETFSIDEKIYLEEIIRNGFSLSATALQNFLNVTDWWPNKYLLNNILKFPQAKTHANIYGTAMHKALEDFFGEYRFQKTFNKEKLFKSFLDSFTKEWIPPEIEKEYKERGVATLEKLYPVISSRAYGELHLEHRFNIEWGGTYLNGIKLTGAIDRIEIDRDNTLIVTDYKTGSGFSTLEWGRDYEAIKKWKYNLQLIFYAILFQESSRWSFFPKREFELFFVEPDKKTGEFYEVKKYVQKDEIDRTKKLIEKVAQHIQALKFPNIEHYSKDITGIRQFEEDLLEWRI